MKKFWIYLAFIMCLFVSSLLNAQIYSWTDENGVKHYSNIPPTRNVEEIEVSQEVESDDSEDGKQPLIKTTEKSQSIKSEQSSRKKKELSRKEKEELTPQEEKELDAHLRAKWDGTLTRPQSISILPQRNDTERYLKN
ncbi:MAG: DUF4124 domain-containing protein [Deltaproteobacteria bacterium]|nr:DUF4124 domain-containing protein [Deltaproteobacteria bacterium]